MILNEEKNILSKLCYCSGYCPVSGASEKTSPWILVCSNASLIPTAFQPFKPIFFLFSLRRKS